MCVYSLQVTNAADPSYSQAYDGNSRHRMHNLAQTVDVCSPSLVLPGCLCSLTPAHALMCCLTGEESSPSSADEDLEGLDKDALVTKLKQASLLLLHTLQNTHNSASMKILDFTVGTSYNRQAFFLLYTYKIC